MEKFTTKDFTIYNTLNDDGKKQFKDFVDQINDYISMWTIADHEYIESIDVDGKNGALWVDVPVDMLIDEDDDGNKAVAYPHIDDIESDGFGIHTGMSEKFLPIDKVKSHSKGNLVNVLVKFDDRKTDFDQYLKYGDMVGIGDIGDNYEIIK